MMFFDFMIPSCNVIFKRSFFDNIYAIFPECLTCLEFMTTLFIYVYVLLVDLLVAASMRSIPSTHIVSIGLTLGRIRI